MELNKDLEYITDKKLYIMLSKNKPCFDCGNKYHYSQMQLDHLPGTDKKFMFGSGRNSKFTLEDYKEELKKCELICANCHSKRTFLRKLSKEFLEKIEKKEIDINNLTNEQIIEYYKNKNKEHLKNHYEKNKEKIKERKKEYREKIKELKNEKNK